MVKMMSNNRILTFIIYGLLMLIGCSMYMLFEVKNQVKTWNAELISIQKQKEVELEAIRLLEVEYAYLSMPERLAYLNKKFLSLQETQLSQIKGDELVQGTQIANNNTKSEFSSNKKIANVQWRYKRLASKKNLIFTDTRPNKNTLIAKK